MDEEKGNFAAEDLCSAGCAGNSGEGWLCCLDTCNTCSTRCKLSSLKQTYTFSTPLQKGQVKGLQFYQSASCSCESITTGKVSLSPRAKKNGRGQKNRSRSILAVRNSHINDDCQMPTWLSISFYQMRLR